MPRSHTPANQSVGLIGVNPETGEVFHTGADRSGTMFTGKWDLSSAKDAVLDLSYANTDAQKGSLKIRYRLIDDDTLEVRSGGLLSPVVKLIRSRSKSG